jgi:general secretion pathway protein G
MSARRRVRASRRTAGFTLIELVVSLALLGVLAMVAMPVAELSWQRDREVELRAALRELRTAIDAYRQASEAGLIAKSPDATGYPPSLEVLVEGVRNQRDPKGRELVFLRRIPRDPFHPDPSVPAERTWTVRAYGSVAGDRGSANADVWDVQSASTRVGLNGIPLRQW